MRRALIRANRLMASGDYAAAASAFGGLTHRARASARPVRAAHLDLQSSRALLAWGQTTAAQHRATAALLTLIGSGRARQAAQLLSRVADAFRDRGHEAEAAQVEADVEQALGATEFSTPRLPPDGDVPPEERGTLPARCPGCGASLLPDEVDWHGTATAECPYCGSAIQAT